MHDCKYEHIFGYYEKIDHHLYRFRHSIVKLTGNTRRQFIQAQTLAVNTPCE